MHRIIDRAGWITAGVLALGIIAFAVREVIGGPLDPPGAPGPRMQTLDNIPPAWDRQLIASDGLGSGCESSRFKCVMLRVICNPSCFFSYEGVLDLETGLVWKRGGGTPVSEFPYWHFVSDGCLKYDGGGRTGWRLPTAAELMALLDRSVVEPAASLPTGHPFLGVTSYDGVFWTSSPDAFGSGAYYAVDFTGPVATGLPGYLTQLQPGADAGGWCVRGANTQ
jgi:hypothetical protein